MHSSGLLALAATVASVSAAAIQGFNYGAQHTDGSAKIQSEFENEFSAAHDLAGTDGAFTSARLYTMIQHGTEGDIISAIPAAIKTKTRLLLGMWASAGQTVITNEINALEAAVEKYGDDFTSLIDGISVGSEDLYRVTPTSQKNEPGSVGASPDALVSYIKQVREAIKGTSLSDASIGHVDTWTAWVNGSNSEVVDACDWVGTDAYPYFQTEMTNSITNGQDLFQEAFDQTKAFSNGKPVWVTETGWPIAGAKKNLAVAGTKEAEIYWQKVGCELLFGSVNTWWYTLSDASPDTPNPTFGILGADLENTPAYDLTCSPKSKSSTKSKTASSKASASKGLDSTVSQAAGSPAITTGASASGGSGSPGSNATAASTFLASTAVPTAASGTGAATPVATGAAVAKAASVGVVIGAVMVAVAAI